jgi:transcriptional accessory protein Tex/SPT6
MFSFRSELTKKAEKSSIEVFATNLKNLLLASPVKGKCILGIDRFFVDSDLKEKICST